MEIFVISKENIDNFIMRNINTSVNSLGIKVTCQNVIKKIEILLNINLNLMEMMKKLNCFELYYHYQITSISNIILPRTCF